MFPVSPSQLIGGCVFKLASARPWLRSLGLVPAIGNDFSDMKKIRDGEQAAACHSSLALLANQGGGTETTVFPPLRTYEWVVFTVMVNKLNHKNYW